MVGRRGEAPLVPPYSFRRPNKAMALSLPELPKTSSTVHSEFIVANRLCDRGLAHWCRSFVVQLE